MLLHFVVYSSRNQALPHASAVAAVLEENDGLQLIDRPIDRILSDESGAACGVEADGVQVKADCVIAAPEYVEDRLEESYKVRRRRGRHDADCPRQRVTTRVVAPLCTIRNALCCCLPCRWCVCSRS